MKSISLKYALIATLLLTPLPATAEDLLSAEEVAVLQEQVSALHAENKAMREQFATAMKAQNDRLAGAIAELRAILNMHGLTEPMPGELSPTTGEDAL